MRRFAWLLLAFVACHDDRPADSADTRRAAAITDSGFAALQERGAVAMGVDQYTSTHLFTPLPDGGTIELQRDSADAAGVAQVRAHMQQIAEMFAAGDFTLPGQVHGQVLPGTDTMRSLRSTITYTVDTLQRGARVRLRTADPAALRAIHEFLAYQRRDHKAGMHHPSAQ